MNLLKTWFRRHLSNPQVVILSMVLLSGFLFVAFLGKILAPVLASLILAYMLEGFVAWGERRRLPRLLGVLLVYTTFLAFLVFLLFALLPMLSRQIAQLVQQIPTMIQSGQQELMHLPRDYPDIISEAQVAHMMSVMQQESVKLGQGLLGLSVTGVRSVITVLIYLVLVPLLIFFFLKDKDKIHDWFMQFLPSEHDLTTQVWRDVDRQIGNYIRGKVWEILLVWVTSYVTFVWLELDYAMLLSLFVGMSVLVPYVGATVMVIPIAVIGYFDFGLTKQFAYVMAAYGIIQTLDGNLLAPLLLSEVVNLHPVAVIVAVLAFGGLWGFWGVFFAIPLATLVQAVIKAWPRSAEAPMAAPPPDEPPAETRVSGADTVT